MQQAARPSKRCGLTGAAALVIVATTAWFALTRESRRNSPASLPFDQIKLRASQGSTDPDLYREGAFRCMRNQQFQEALGWISRARNLDPYNAENDNLKGMAYAELHNNEKATAAFRRASQLDPKAEAPHLNLGRLALKHEALWLATTEFEAAKAVAPRDPEPLVLLGLTLKERAFSVSAKGTIKRALEINPNLADAHAALGEVYVDFGQPLEARKELQKAIDLGDTTPKTRAALGLAYAILPLTPRDADTAIENLRHAEGVGEHTVDVYYGLGLAYQAKKDYANAEKALLSGLEIAPGSEGMYYTLAHVYLTTCRQERGKAMLARYDKLIKARQLRESLKSRADGQPTRVDLRVQYADMLLQDRKFDEAAGEYVRALDHDPESAEIYHKLAIASDRAGRPDAATEARVRERAILDQRSREGASL